MQLFILWIVLSSFIAFSRFFNNIISGNKRQEKTKVGDSSVAVRQKKILATVLLGGFAGATEEKRMTGQAVMTKIKVIKADKYFS